MIFGFWGYSSISVLKRALACIVEFILRKAVKTPCDKEMFAWGASLLRARWYASLAGTERECSLMASRKFLISAGARGGENDRNGRPVSRDKKRRSSKTGSPISIMSKGVGLWRVCENTAAMLNRNNNRKKVFLIDDFFLCLCSLFFIKKKFIVFLQAEAKTQKNKIGKTFFLRNKTMNSNRSHT